MPQNKKTRKINFYSFITRQKDDMEDVRPAIVVRDVINHIKSLKPLDRKHDCTSNKFCYLEYIEEEEVIETVNNKQVSYFIHKLYFVSAKHSYSADLIDRTTVKKRKNPKTLTEGEGEKTHMCIRYTHDDVLVFMERNGNGVSIQQVLGYLKNFTKQYYKDVLNQKINFILDFQSLAKDDFLEEVEDLERVVAAKVYVSKSILGSNALGYSNRTINAQHEIIFEVRAEKNMSIGDVALDIYSSFTRSGTQIKKIRVEGKNKSNNHVVIDTKFIERVEHFDAELNSLTGEVETTNFISNLTALAKTF